MTHHTIRGPISRFPRFHKYAVLWICNGPYDTDTPTYCPIIHIILFCCLQVGQ